MRSLGLTSISILALMLFGALVFGTTGQTTSEHSAKAALVSPLTPPQGASLEQDTNRPGSDYKDYELSRADPAVCQNDCANDPTCKAFTYVKPGQQGSNAHCWLKNAVPNAQANSCCLSGVKSGGSTEGGLEVNINRLGGDYQDFEVRDNDPYQCRNACQNDSRCQSFTYLRASYRGPYAHCFLKNSVPSATQNSCCISGVIRTGGGGGGGGGNGGCGNDFGIQAPQSAASGSRVRISFSYRGERPTGQTHWIGLFRAGEAGTREWYWVKDLQGCDASFGTPEPGDYEFRYLLDGGYDKVAARAPISIR